MQAVKTESQPSGGLQQRVELKVVVPKGVLNQEWLKRIGLAGFTDEGVETNALGIVFTTEFDRISAIIER